MIPLDWSVLLPSGMAVALLNWKKIKKLPSLVSNRFFRRLFLWYFYFIFGTIFFYILYPDWMWGYLTRATDVNPILGAIFFYLWSGLMLVVGYLSMAVFIREKEKKVQVRGVLGLLLASLILMIMLMVGLKDEFFTLTSYDGFNSGVREPAKYKELFWPIYVAVGVLMVGIFNWFFSWKDKYEKKDKDEEGGGGSFSSRNSQQENKKDLII